MSIEVALTEMINSSNITYIKHKFQKYCKILFYFLMDVEITNYFILAKEYIDLSLQINKHT